MPNRLVVSYEQPGIMATAHWHAQVEVNYVFRGACATGCRAIRPSFGPATSRLFWGGLPHQVVDTAEDALFVAIHLPLVHFFRLRLAGRDPAAADARGDAGDRAT